MNRNPAPAVSNPVNPGGGPAAPIMGEAVKWAAAIHQWTDWLTAAGARPRTIELRQYQIRRLAEAHLCRSPWRVTTADLVGWVSGQDWSAETRRSYRSALRSFFGWAKESGHVRRDPARALPVVHAPIGVPRPTPDPVFRAAFEAADDRARLILCLAGLAGLRRAEIAGLRWVDVDDTTLRIRGKGGKVRTVPLHPDLAYELVTERKRRDAGDHGSGYRYTSGLGDGWVFPGQCGGHLTPNALGKAACRALGPGWSAHTLRHRFATRAYAGSRDLLTVQQLLGHASPTTTTRYTQLPDGALAAAVALI